MAEPAQFRAGDLVAADLGGGEVHVDRQAGHGILLEAHLWNKETVDDVVGAQNDFDLASDGNFHNAGDHVVLRCRVLRVQTQRGFAARRRIFQFRLGRAKFSVRAGIAEVPGELHAGDFDSGRPVHGGTKTFRRPDGAADQVQSDKEDDGERGPDNFELGVAVGIAGAAGWRRGAILEDEDIPAPFGRPRRQRP